VAVLNHHGNSDGSNAFFLSVLRPRLLVANVWAARQVDPETLARLRSERIYPGQRDIFATTGMWDGRADQGHIVVRVAAGGMSYRVFVLDDSDETMRIKSVHGPYTSH
jgi:hypothetical protein